MATNRKGPTAVQGDGAPENSRYDGANTDTLPKCLFHAKPDYRLAGTRHMVLIPTDRGWYGIPWPEGPSFARRLGRQQGEAWQAARALPRKQVLVNGAAE